MNLLKRRFSDNVYDIPYLLPPQLITFLTFFLKDEERLGIQNGGVGSDVSVTEIAQGDENVPENNEEEESEEEDR